MRRVLVAMLLLAAAAPAGAHVGRHDVAIRDNLFDPQRLSVDPGESVTWVAETGGHTVTSDTGLFDVSLNRGETFARALPSVGAYFYHCKVHGSPGNGASPGSGMAGVIVVGPELVPRDGDAVESSPSVQVDIALDRPSSNTVSASYGTSAGTAEPGSDFEPASGTVTFAPGETSKTVSVQLVDDVVVEPAEWFSIDILGVAGAALIDASARVTLSDDDGGSGCTVPSGLCPTIEAALSVALPDAVIAVEPGTYRLTRSITVDVPRVRIVGSGPGVVIEPSVHVDHGFLVLADGVHLEGLTLQKFPVQAVEWRSVRTFSARDVRVLGTTGLYGFLAVDSRRGVLTDIQASRAERAAIAIMDCDPCDVVVSRATAERSYVGLEITRATSVVVRDSTFTRNRNGIALRSPHSTAPALQRGAHLIGNVISDSGDGSALKPPSLSTKVQRGDLVSGAGIWMAGGTNDVVEGNVISGGRYGVLVAGFGLPATDLIIRGNEIVQPASYGLAWDGVGADVCFAGNSGDGAARTSPPSASEIYSCSLPATAGIPNPVLLAELAREAVP